MPVLKRKDVRIRFEEFGDPNGEPVLCLAPGGMRSSIEMWHNSDYDPTTALSGYRVIAMDQRNAGQSFAPVTGLDGWESYTSDQVALLNHLGIDRVHVLGKCIGGPFALGLIDADPARVASAVLMQPIGHDNNRDVFFGLFNKWFGPMKDQHPEATATDWASFRENMFGGEFVFSLPKSWMRGCDTPLLLFHGDDIYHPVSISEKIAELAPNLRSVPTWKGQKEMIARRISTFLANHSIR